ncbi:MAG: HaeIII family restriction endonuclease, partial [Treponema sp.]|nr:HaeIII family restriction endonuclease [Treponema sp.]
SNGKDYYKMIHYKNNKTRIQPFNLLGTLNQAASKKKPSILFSKTPLPTKIIELAFKENSKTTLELTMNNGWAISFRIHNAKTKVETSLKFDIQLLGQPSDLFYKDVDW